MYIYICIYTHVYVLDTYMYIRPCGCRPGFEGIGYTLQTTQTTQTLIRSNWSDLMTPSYECCDALR